MSSSNGSVSHGSYRQNAAAPLRAEKERLGQRKAALESQLKQVVVKYDEVSELLRLLCGKGPLPKGKRAVPQPARDPEKGLTWDGRPRQRAAFHVNENKVFDYLRANPQGNTVAGIARELGMLTSVASGVLRDASRFERTGGGSNGRGAIVTLRKGALPISVGMKQSHKEHVAAVTRRASVDMARSDELIKRTLIDRGVDAQMSYAELRKVTGLGRGEVRSFIKRHRDSLFVDASGVRPKGQRGSMPVLISLKPNHALSVA